MIRNWYRKLPIAHKIRILLITAGMASILCFSSVYIYFGAIILKANILADAANAASMFGSRNITAIKFQSRDFAEKNLRSLKDNPSHDAICIYDAKGGLFAKFLKKNNWSCPKLRPEWNGTFSEKDLEISDQIYVLRNIYSEGDIIGASLVVANQNTLTKYVTSQLGIMSVIAIIAIILCSLLSNYLQRLLSRPIIDIAHDFQTIAQSEPIGSRIAERYEDEIGQVANAFNRILTLVEDRNQETIKKLEVATRAHIEGTRRIEELQNQFSESSESFSVYIQLLNEKVLGEDSNRYLKYQADVFEAMETFNIKISSFKRLTELYSNAISGNPVEIELIAYLDNFMKKIKAVVPFIMIRRSSAFTAINSPIKAKVYKMAWDETFAIIINLFDTLCGFVEFPPQIALDYNTLDHKLCISFVSSEHNARNISSGFVKFGRLKESQEFNSEYSGECEFRKGTIEDPEVAGEFINSDIIQRDHLKYILDSMSYIANANAMEIEHQFANEQFHIILDLKGVMFSESKILKSLEIQ